MALAAAVALLLLFVVRVELIVGGGTYPRHVDEWFLAKKALHIVQTGDPNPGWFRYGSLPIYLTAGSMAAGVELERAHGTLDDAGDVSSIHYPYYSHPAVMWAARMVFALVSVLGLLGAGLVGYGLVRRPAGFFLPIMTLSCSQLYLNQSWTYLNVDIIASSLCLLALAYLVHTRDRSDLIARALVPALFCGAITASKYNSGLIGVPFLVAALQSRRPSNVVLLLVLSLLAFFAFQPFALLDFSRFVDDARAEARHYWEGRPEHDPKRGIFALGFYASELARDVGWGLAVSGLLGFHRSLQSSRHTTWLVLSFPALMLLHMSTQRLHMTRSVLPAFAVLAVFMGLGLLACWEFVARRNKVLTAATVLGLVFVVSLGPGLSSLARGAWQPADSRVALGRWLHAHAGADCEVLVPRQLVIDPRDLEHCRMRYADPSTSVDADALRLAPSSQRASERYVLYAAFADDDVGSRDRGRAWKRLVRGAEPTFATGARDVRLTSKPRKRSIPDPRLRLFRLPR